MISKESIIEFRKQFNKILRNAQTSAKKDSCYYCGNEVTSFCNSHSIPRFMLKNIDYKTNGNIATFNSTTKIPFLDETVGLNSAGTFKLICNECDSTIFKNYETKNNYECNLSQQMLREIEMKNSLKNISKRLIEIEVYKENDISIDTFQELKVKMLDLEEYKKVFSKCKKNKLLNYHVGLEIDLDYITPIAFQGSIAIVTDLEGNIINNVLDHSCKNEMVNINVCVFPLEKTTKIVLFIDKKCTKYQRFFKQLNKLTLIEKLKVINFIIFYYSEDYFLYSKLDEEYKNNIGKITNIMNSSHIVPRFNTTSNIIKIIKENYNYTALDSIPNILDKSFKIERGV